MARGFTLLVTVLVMSGCASELVLDRDAALAVIPHQVSESGHIVVETMLNGYGPFKFALDTGASISAVFDRARTEAALESAGGEAVHILGMTGSGRFPVADVARITVGSEIWEDARVALLPDATPVAAQIDGILGVDFLSRYAVWYSQRERLVCLYPRELVAQRSFLGWNSIPLTNLDVGDGEVTLLAFDMYIDAQRIPTLFDLGASVNLMNRRAAKLLGVPTRRPHDVPDLWGVTGEATVMTELIIWQLQIAHMYWRNRTFLVDDFPIFEAFDITSKPVAIAGMNLFQQRDFIIDFAGKRLLVASRE